MDGVDGSSVDEAVDDVDAEVDDTVDSKETGEDWGGNDADAEEAMEVNEVVDGVDEVLDGTDEAVDGTDEVVDGVDEAITSKTSSSRNTVLKRIKSEVTEKT